MTFYYKPTVTQAYNSVSYLMTDVSFGWLIDPFTGGVHP